jgi:glutamate/tyrosine decarboxylase-like PLP-dependent enzyme
MNTLLEDASKRASAYLEGVESRRVVPSSADLANLEQFDRPFPEASTAAAKVLDELDRFGSPATVATAGGRFFGFVNGGAFPASVAASFLASAWDQNAALRVMAPGAAKLEDVVLAWVAEALGIPSGGGAIVTGATMANFCGLAAARHALLERAGWDVENDGLFGAPPITVVVGEEVHASLLKALGMLAWAESAWCESPSTARVVCAPMLCRRSIRGPSFVSRRGT